jgi:flagellar basal-body rod protein FlgB
MFGLVGDSLQLRSHRMAMLASNIANAATPNYKARDLDFDAALTKASAGRSMAQTLASETRFRVPLSPSVDGNTVELSTEQTLFAENAVRYRATLSFLEGRVDTLRRAMKGE